jgi:tRNA threonylcarbamoyladenosine biosynthesis protein TsaE
MSVEVRPIGPEDAALLLETIRPAFEARPRLDPPAATLTE